MIPIPIFIHSDSPSVVGLIVPNWVNVIAALGVVAALLGIVWTLIVMILQIITDDAISSMDPPHSYSIALILIGVLLLIIAVGAALFVGTPITE